MPGWENRIAFNNGMGIEESESQEYTLCQNRPNSVSVLNVDGSPEGVAVANEASIAFDRTNGDWYRKDTGTGNTGWVLANGAGLMIDIEGDDGVPITPDGTGTINFNGITVANATNAKPLFFKGTPGSFLEEAEIQVSIGLASAPGDALDAGICSFDNTAFSVNSTTGFVQLIGGGTPTVQILTDDGVPSVVPDGSGEIDILGGVNISSTGQGPGNTVTISATDFASIVYSEVTMDTNPMVAYTDYSVNSASSVTMTLPSTSAVGEVFIVKRINTGDVSIAQQAGQTIHYNGTDTTTGAGGSLDSNARWDCIWLQTVVTDTDFIVINSSGSWTAN